MRHVITLFLIVFTTVLFAQDFEPPKIKFGDVTEQDLLQSDYEILGDEDAIYLFDKIDYSYTVLGEDMALKEVYYARIKIIDKDAVDLGDLKITFMHGDRYQKVTEIKAAAHNLENGKVVTSKLSKKDIFDKKLDDEYSQITFAIPNVKEGSIMEYQFTLTSRNQVRPSTWYFSNSYPVVYSQVSLNVPEWYNFAYYHRGYQNFSYQNVEANNQSFGAGFSKVPSSLNTWGKSNIKAYKDEDYTANINDFREQMQFRLNSIQYSNKPRKIFNTTWEKLNMNLLEVDYADQQKDKKYIDDIVAQVIRGKETEEDKIKALFDYIVENIEIEKDGWIYTSHPVKRVLKDKKGNLADANLLLVNMLQSAGIEAYPLLISTRTDGYIDRLYANTRAFSYPVAYVKREKKDLIMNATSAYRPYYLPRFIDYNIEGWAVKKEGSGWVKTEHLAPNSVRLYDIDATLEENGTYKGSVAVSSSNYLSVSDRIKVEEDGVEERLKEQYDGENEIVISDTEKGDIKDAYSNFKFSANFEVEDHAPSINDFIYFNPVLFELDTENPFIEEDRKYPVDFPYPRRTIQKVKVKLPVGYVLDEVPEPKRVSLSDIAYFKLAIDQREEGYINVVVEDVLKKTVIGPQDYPYLKQYIDEVIKVTNSQITLRKAE